MSIKGYFCDINGVIYTVADFYDGGSNAPYAVIVEGSTVMHVGAYSDGDGYPVEEEYTLWPTLSSLASAIEED